MSGSVPLEIVTGSDWATEIFWQDQFSNGVPYTAPSMEIRQDLNPTSPRIARLDSTGSFEGVITITDIGKMLLYIPASVTTNMTPGTAFWDLFLTLPSNQRVRLLFGSVAIRSHVTAS